MRAALPGAALGVDDPLLRGRTGAGVRVAILDSGVNPANPHVTPPAEGVAVAEDGGEGQDLLDRLGHGTAVTAAVQEKAPAAEILTVKIFHETLSARIETLIGGLDEAVAFGARIVNLSLGVPTVDHRDAIRGAVERARREGALVVSPREHRGLRWWPGAARGAAGVLLDWDCPRSELRLMRSPGGEPIFRASGYPRPIPGVPRDRNARGISFAAANVTGILALLMEGEPELDSVERVAERLTTGRS